MVGGTTTCCGPPTSGPGVSSGRGLPRGSTPGSSSSISWVGGTGAVGFDPKASPGPAAASSTAAATHPRTVPFMSASCRALPIRELDLDPVDVVEVPADALAPAGEEAAVRLAPLHLEHLDRQFYQHRLAADPA